MCVWGVDVCGGFVCVCGCVCAVCVCGGVSVCVLCDVRVCFFVCMCGVVGMFARVMWYVYYRGGCVCCVCVVRMCVVYVCV